MAEAEGSPAERSRWCLAVAQPDRDDRNLHPAVLCQLRQPHQAAAQLDRTIASLNLALGKHHQLLSIGEKIDRQAKGRHGRPSLVHWKTTKPMQEPSLQSSHFCGRHHEPAVTTADASSGCHGKQQGIPSGAMRR